MNISFLNFDSMDSLIKFDYFWLSLKSYIEDNSVNSAKINWSYPLNDSNYESVNDVVNKLLSEEPDIVLCSFYVWNHLLQTEILKELKNRNPNITIICGGPNFYYTDEFFKTHSYIDFCCSTDGYGEVFFLEYIDQYFGNKEWDKVPFLISSEIKSTTQFKKTAFKWPKNIYGRNKEYLLSVKEYAKSEGIQVYSILEGSRGCPYSCTFCEWGGGTASKMAFKPLEYILEDLDVLLNDIEVEILSCSDSNFGIIPRDEVIANYIIENSKKSFQMFSILGPSKTNKETLYRIENAFMNSRIGFEIKLSIQDFSETVKNNIKRTDVPWEEQLEHYKSTEENGTNLVVEMMLGLPGATLDEFYDSLDIIYKNNIICNRYEWLLLDTTPAAEQSYIDEFKIETTNIRNIRKTEIKNKKSLLSKRKYELSAEIVVKTSTYSKKEWVEMYTMHRFLKILENDKYLTPITSFLYNNNIKHSTFYKSFWCNFVHGQYLDSLSQTAINNAVTELSERVHSGTISEEQINTLPFGFNVAEYEDLNELIKIVINRDINSFYIALTNFICAEIIDESLYTDLYNVIIETVQSVQQIANKPKEFQGYYD